MKKLLTSIAVLATISTGAFANVSQGVDVNQGVQNVLDSVNNGTDAVQNVIDAENQHWYDYSAAYPNPANLFQDIGLALSGNDDAKTRVGSALGNFGDAMNHIIAADTLQNGQINQLNHQIDTINKDLKAGIAGIAALSSVSVSDVKRGEVSVGGGYGSYAGQNAMAFGVVVGLRDNWSVNTGVSLGGAESAYRVGTNYKFKAF
jgi:autotransporter adhesin